MVSISVRTKLSALKLLLLLTCVSAITSKIYSGLAKTQPSPTASLTKGSNSSHNTNSTAVNTTKTDNNIISDDSDPVAQKILQLFAASILAFGSLVADPHNPSNIKSALFSMATCWYKIFMTATAPEA